MQVLDQRQLMDHLPAVRALLPEPSGISRFLPSESKGGFLKMGIGVASYPRATVIARTEAAPPLSSTRAHSSRVDPVVSTSSTRTR